MLTPEQIERTAREHGVDATRLSTIISFASAIERAAMDATIERCAQNFAKFFGRGEQLDVGYVIDSILALKQREGL
jgi:hypothetical protein